MKNLTRLISTIRKEIEVNKLRIENAHRLPQSVIDAMIADGIFKLLVPKQFNGKNASLPEAVLTFEALSKLDGNVGWIAGIGAGGAIFSGHLPPKTATQIFSPKNALIAGSGFPSGKAIPVKGGYEVTGRWKYCSGAPHASFFTAMCMVPKKEGDEMLAVAMAPDQIKIEETWNAVGLKATASDDVVAEKVFVPTNHTFVIDESNPKTDVPIMRYPFVQLAEASFASVVLGIALHFVDAIEEITNSKKDHWKANQPQAIPIANQKVADAKKKMNQGRDRFYEAVEQSWMPYANHEKASDVQLKEVAAASRQIASVSRQVSVELLPLAGMKGIMQDEPINRIWRDLYTAAQHALLSSLRG